MLPGVALITGAGGTGIGAAIARAFVQNGCSRILITDINPSTLNATAQSLASISPGRAPQVSTLAGDIASSAHIDKLFEQVKGDFGRIDYLVNCAGIGGSNKPTDETGQDEFDRLNGVNYKGLWMCSRKALGMMKGQEIEAREGVDPERAQRGSIVNIASQLAFVGRENAAVYCATKSAVLSLTRCDAVDYSSHRIRINAVCPGIIETPMTKSGGGDGAFSVDTQTLIAPMARKGKVEEVADVVCFLASEKASFVQGASWVVDGGYTIV